MGSRGHRALVKGATAGGGAALIQHAHQHPGAGAWRLQGTGPASRGRLPLPGGHGPGGTCWGDRAAEGRQQRRRRGAGGSGGLSGVHAARGGGRRKWVARGRLGGPRGQGRGGVTTGRRPYPAFRPLPCPPKAEGKTREPTTRSRAARPRASRPKRGWCPRHCAASSPPGPQSSRVSGKCAQATFPEQRVGAQARGGPGLPPERWVLDPPSPDPQKGEGSRAAVAPRRPSCSPVLARRQGTESRGRRWALLKPAGPPSASPCLCLLPGQGASAKPGSPDPAPLRAPWPARGRPQPRSCARPEPRRSPRAQRLQLAGGGPCRLPCPRTCPAPGTATTRKLLQSHR